MKLNKALNGFLLILWVIQACDSPGVEQTKPEAAEEKHVNDVWLNRQQVTRAGIDTIALREMRLNDALQVRGRLDAPPAEKVTISAMYGGYLRGLNLMEGSSVTKGQVLAYVEHPVFLQLQQDYLETLGQLELARLENERQQLLAKAQVNAQKTAEQSLAAYRLQVARQKGLEAKLKQAGFNPAALSAGTISPTAALRAPLSGFVTQVPATNGIYLKPEDPVLTITNTRHLHAALEVFEKDVSNLQIGQEVAVQAPGINRSWTARIELIGKEVSADRTVAVHCHFLTSDEAMVPGLFVMASIAVQSANVPVLPEGAVLLYLGKPYVFIPLADGSKKDQRFGYRLQQVTTGIRSQGFVEIKAGLLPGQAVVHKGAHKLLGALKNEPPED